MAILKIRDEAGNVFEVPAIKGKSAYQYAQDGGYTGTEAEFARLLGEMDDRVDISSILTNYYLKTEADALHSEIEDYVDTQVAALVNSAPETLDTLGELATAFNENKEVVETLDKAITTKANQSDLTALSNTVASHTTVINAIEEETWTFTLDDGSTVTKKVAILS